MKNCHCHGNSIKKWKNHYPIVKHLVGLNTADNKLFLQRSDMIAVWFRSNPTNTEAGLAFNPDTVHPHLGTFRVWKPSPPGRAFSRTMWGKPSRAHKDTCNRSATQQFLWQRSFRKLFSLRALCLSEDKKVEISLHPGGQQSSWLFPSPVTARAMADPAVLSAADTHRIWGCCTGGVLHAAWDNLHAIWSHVPAANIGKGNLEDNLAFPCLHGRRNRG